MKKKRKYTRKPDALGLNSSPTKEESGTIPRGVKAFSFNDLPLSVRMQIENTIKMRERLGLPDDSEERRVLAVRYFRGDRPR